MFGSIMRWAREVDAQRALQVSLACLGFALAIALSTILPGAPFLPEWVVFPLLLGAILVHSRTVALVMVQPPKRRRLNEVMKFLPRPTRWAFTAAAVASWGLLVALLLGAVGGPTQSDGHFYLNDHGVLIPVSHAGYVAEQLRIQRIFSLCAALFFGAAVVVNWVALRAPEAFPSQLDQPG